MDQEQTALFWSQFTLFAIESSKIEQQTTLLNHLYTNGYSSFWFDTINLGYSIVHIWGCQALILKKKNWIILSEDQFDLYKQCRP